MAIEVPKAGPTADLVDVINTLRAGLMAGADAAVAQAEAAVSAAQANLAATQPSQPAP